MADAQEFDISQLPLEQLALLKSQFEEEIQHLQRLNETLREAIARFENTSIALRAISSQNEGASMLIPMTSSLYVPGKIRNVNKVLVDVGTGYFIEKGKDDAIKYVQRKLDMMYDKENEAAIGLMKKRESLKVTSDLLQLRLMELQARRQ
eukprot:TRINITY_DN29588_c0_g1_i1.p1 TRINITY_DN29588_c0_g1~~TRINITY_DN29588_c0_g1_i1.p1  ORF type:complete len:150 (+),score=50.91 TRINITY_DN29588_c0_g1_i1:61-510(+)